MKSSSNVHKAYGNTKDIMSNTSAGIKAKISWHDTISHFSVTSYNFCILYTDIRLPLNNSSIHGDQIQV